MIRSTDSEEGTGTSERLQDQIIDSETYGTADNFEGVVDRNGNLIDFSSITVTGTVDTNAPANTM